MTLDEAKKIPYFTVKEIEATGAKLTDVSFDLMKRLCDYRALSANPIQLLFNGLTTGDHEPGSYHFRKEGAVDFIHGKPVEVNTVVEQLLKCGFGGIGAYHNGLILSFHADPRKDTQLWHGLKAKPGEPWKYGPLIAMPMYW